MGDQIGPAHYQIIVACGSTTEQIERLGDAIVRLTPEGEDAAAVLHALDQSALRPSDLRARALLVFADDVSPVLAAQVYAALTGFAARKLDIGTSAGLLQGSRIHNAAVAKIPDQRPDHRPELVEVRADEEASTDVDWPTVRFDPAQPLAMLSPTTAMALRFARDVRVAPADDLTSTLVMLMVTAAARSRGEQDRFPHLHIGETTVDLDEVRQRAAEVRRNRKPYVLPVDPPFEPQVTERQRRLATAADADIEETLRMLGARYNEEAATWHCPRPERHRNGDRNPSTKVEGNRIRCYGRNCDAEPVTPLRLVVDTLGVGPDDAADILLGESGQWAEELLTERRRSHPNLTG